MIRSYLTGASCEGRSRTIGSPGRCRHWSLNVGDVHRAMVSWNRGQALHVNVLVTHVKRLTQQAGLPEVQFHDLRHTAATLLLAIGEHPKIVQERLGHADIA